VVRLLSPIRVPSPRQLPTDHDCAVSTRGYQSDQPSHWPLVLSPALSLLFAEARLNLNLDTVAPYQKEYLAAENKILRAHLPARLRLSDPERSTLAEIAKRLGRKEFFMGRLNGKNPELGTPNSRCYCRSTVKRLIEYPSAPPMKTSDKK